VRCGEGETNIGVQRGSRMMKTVCVLDIITEVFYMTWPTCNAERTFGFFTVVLDEAHKNHSEQDDKNKYRKGTTDNILN